MQIGKERQHCVQQGQKCEVPHLQSMDICTISTPSVSPFHRVCRLQAIALDAEDLNEYLEYVSQTVFQHEPLEGLAEFQKLFTRLGKKALSGRPLKASTWPPHAPDGGGIVASQDYESLPAEGAGLQLGARSRNQMHGAGSPGRGCHGPEPVVEDPGTATASHADAQVRVLVAFLPCPTFPA